MSGLQKILKATGEMKVGDKNGFVVWVWDYINDCPAHKKDLTKEQLKANKAARLRYLAGLNPAPPK